MVMTKTLIDKAAFSVLIVGILTYAFLTFLVPIQDPDFWWHLKTGDYIVENRELPTNDPFSHTDLSAEGKRERLFLTQYWLYQVVLYGSYAAAGFKGVIAFRALILALMFYTVFSRMRKHNINGFLVLVVLSLSLLSFAPGYMNDRPQMFSFLFGSVLLGMMERIREGGKPSIMLLPMMLLWSNVHGGFVVGDILIGIFALGFLIQHRHDRKKTAIVLLLSFAGIAVSFINPNSYQAFAESFKLLNTTAMWFIIEYRSTFDAFAAGSNEVLFLWTLILLTLIGMVLSRRLYLPDVFLFIFTGYISIRYVRNAAFFSVCMAPMAAYYLDKSVRRFSLPKAYSPVLKAVVIVLLVGLIYDYSSKSVSSGSPLRAEKSAFYPDRAASFIDESGIAGRMFNEYDWGGFLIWRLHPKYKVFIDGRCLHEPVLQQYISIAKGSKYDLFGIPEYKAYLDTYNVNFVLQPLRQKNGMTQPLMKRLLDDKDWAPVYLDNQAYVFARKVAGNTHVINKYGYDKAYFKGLVLLMFDSMLKQNPNNIGFYLSKGEMLMYMRRFEEAEQVFMNAQRISPSNKYIRETLNLLDSIRKKNNR
jgi:hypothetical protein